MMLKILIGLVRSRECGDSRFFHYENEYVLTMNNDGAVDEHIKKIESE